MMVSTGCPSHHFCATRVTLTATSSRSLGSFLPSRVTHVASLVNLTTSPWMMPAPSGRSLPTTPSSQPSKLSTFFTISVMIFLLLLIADQFAIDRMFIRRRFPLLREFQISLVLFMHADAAHLKAAQ